MCIKLAHLYGCVTTIIESCRYHSQRSLPAPPCRLAVTANAPAGGLAPDARKQLVRISEAQSNLKTRRPTEVRVAPGTVLVREFGNREHQGGPEPA
jgi:hypothetical protein